METINQLVIKGIKDGRQAFIGPGIVQIDLTGKCNNDCIGCWVHSPFVKNRPADKDSSLPYEKVKTLIEDLKKLGTKEIFISGAGEPFLHPHILEVITLIKENGFKLNVITNCTLLDEQKSERMIDLGVDMITASIWAATPETYVKTHPSRQKEDFYRIKNSLKAISELKNRKCQYLPHIKIYNVICNLNYEEISEMIDFALETQVEFVEFQIMDIIEGETSFLALSPHQIKEIKKQFKDLKGRKDLYFRELGLKGFMAQRDKELKEFAGRFIKVQPGVILKEWIQYTEGIGEEALHSLVCSNGTATLPTKTNPFINEIDNKVTFNFPEESCRNCPAFQESCFVDKDNKITYNFLTTLGFGSFLRRLNSANIYEQIYEKEVIDNLPCYVGWIYSRILSTGEVIPCCKAVTKKLGNIYENRFLEIWNSEPYRNFRHKAKNFPKSDSYFRSINCYKSCDNVGMNLQIKENLVEDSPKTKGEIIIPAANFQSGNLNLKDHKFGEGIVIDGGEKFGFAEYKVNFRSPGKYEFWSYYATDEIRPVRFYFDGKVIKEKALKDVTSGWMSKNLRWFKETSLDISEGEHTFKIHTKGYVPHIHSFAFVPEGHSGLLKGNRDLSENIYRQPSSFKQLRDKFKTIGFIDSSVKLINHIGSGRLVQNYLDILGVFNGQYAFKGPLHVQIDLTNDCNNNCIGCWCNSPLLEEKAIPPRVKKQFLPFSLLKELLDELSPMGTKEIYFSGGGEPFMHPEIMDILVYAKKKNFTCYVNTNFTLLDKEKIEKIIEIGLDHLTVSTWAGTPQTYAATHPNKSEETFNQIKANLTLLNSAKRRTPYIKLYNVIFNLNYHELEEIVDFARETGSESVEFALIDTVPGKTDKLLLNPQQIKILQDKAKSLNDNLDKRGCLDEVLLFRFDSFLRRICSSNDLSKATYDRNIIDKMPCYIGWCFSRIMPDGNVNSCLKAHRIPVGNLYHNSFSQIWNGEKQQYFRRKTLVYEKNDPFFYLIGNDPEIKEAGCYKSCDDIGRNIYLHNRIMSLTPLERGLLRLLARIRKKPRLNFVKPGENVSKDKILEGIINGRTAFSGPEQVVIDITNRCNEKCIGCWLYSPLLKNNSNGQWLKKEIDFLTARRLIDELSDLGTKIIRFTGGGEPFMHPNLMDLIEYTKAKGLKCCLTTNFSLVDEDKIRKLIDLEVDELAVSLWAASEETYKKTHPNSQEDMFERINKNLRYLTSRKKSKPFVTLCNVICNLNYKEVEEMFRFALDMQVDAVYFTLIDTIDGATDALILNEKETGEVLKMTRIIRNRHHELAQDKKIELDYFDGFIARLKEKSGLTGNYDRQRVNQIPCYAGWIFTRVLADGAIAPCCRAVKKIMGNINEQTFKDIWMSPPYNEFRARAKYLLKTDLYFSEIGCLKMCDNLMHNEQIYMRLKS